MTVHAVNGCRSRGTLCFIPFRGKILPLWIQSADEPVFLLSSPAFELLLSIYRFAYLIEALPVHQSSCVVPVAEAFENMIFVLPHPFMQIACHADVQRTAGRALHDVNVEVVLACHLLARSNARSLDFARDDRCWKITGRIPFDL